jgi:LAS superfamily LD-carboxypeptidase LdcB
MKIGNSKFYILTLIFLIFTALLSGLCLYSYNEYNYFINCKHLQQDYQSLSITSPAIECNNNSNSFKFKANESLYNEVQKNISQWETKNANAKSDLVTDLTAFNNAGIENRSSIFKDSDNLLSLLKEHSKIKDINKDLFNEIENNKKTLDSYKAFITDSKQLNIIDSIKDKSNFQLLSTYKEVKSIIEEINTKFLASRNNKSSLTDQAYLQLKTELKTMSASDFLAASDEAITLKEKAISTTLYSTEADKVIYDFAFKRGYKYRKSAEIKNLTGTSDKDLDVVAMKQLQAMIQSGSQDGYNFILESGYRNESLQKTIFTNRLQEECNKINSSPCRVDEIISGKANQPIEEVLRTSSVPGTSKHHTGLTIDLSEYRVVLTGFINTRSYQWLSQDNFFNSKRFGYVPSYPLGGSNMGPDPEPWEYIYVGIDKLKK